MALERLYKTKEGKVFVSIILGIGMASLFRKICTDGNCIQYKQAPIDSIKDKVFRSNNKCYTYTMQNEKCNVGKQIIS